MINNSSAAQAANMHSSGDVVSSRDLRVLRTLGQCMRLTVRAATEDELFSAICNLIIQSPDYTQAVIGYVEHDDAKSVRVVATAGFDEAIVRHYNTISWDEQRPNGQGAVGEAIRGRRRAIRKGFASDPGLAVWKDIAAKYGYDSVAAFPIFLGDELLAVIAIYFVPGFPFYEDEMDLLQAIVDDIGHGIALIRMREERTRANEALARETSERKALETQLLQADKLNAIAQLTGGIAHDFNNKLGVIRGNLQLIAMLVRDHQDLVPAVEAAKRATDSAASLVHSLLAFAGRQHASSKLVNIPELVKSTVSMLSRVVGTNIIIDTRHDDSQQNVIVDPARLEAALTNFILNSRDAIPGGGRISISTGTIKSDGSVNQHLLGYIGKFVFICVEDTGTGIPADLLERVREPFFTTKPIGTGTGLGLAIAYAFARQSLGVLHIESEFGHGTVVKLFLPSAETSDDIAMLQEASSNIESAGSGTILVVEDEDDLRSAISIYLRAIGYTVVEARTWDAALGILKANVDIDVLFADVILPDGRSGFDLIADALLFQPGCGIILTSGNIFPQYDHSDSLKGKYIFVEKPYDFHSIGNTILSLLEGDSGNRC